MTQHTAVVGCLLTKSPPALDQKSGHRVGNNNAAKGTSTAVHSLQGCDIKCCLNLHIDKANADRHLTKNKSTKS